MKQHKQKLKLTDQRLTFKPFTYPWAYDAWLTHEQIHWTHSVVPMHDDIKDFKKKLTPDQKNFLTQILRLFTQGDIDVAEAYVKNYLPVFPQPEIRMMLLGFANREAIHIAAYSHLLESLGFKDEIYSEFLEYEEMVAKHDFFEQITGTDSHHIVQQMCAVSAFTEGLQLFSSFVMLLNFGRNNLLPGTTKIVTWSIIDESCLISTTYVMTNSGWKFIKDVTLSDKVLQYDQNTGKTSFVNPTNLICKRVDKTFAFTSDDFSQIVSADHRMIVDIGGGNITEMRAEDAYEANNFSFILSGKKSGSLKQMSDKHLYCCYLSATGQMSLSDWIEPILEEIDSEWALEFLQKYDYYKNNPKDIPNFL